MSKLITVFGSTGKQGGPVARALLDRGFKVRGVTRNPDSDKALALKKLGVEVKKGDLDDQASVDAVVEGAYGVFLVTNWEYSSAEREKAQAHTVAASCKTFGVQHLVFSGLDPVKETTGKDCPFFDSKAAIEKHLDENGIPNTSVRYPGYFENFLEPFIVQKQDDGTFVWTACMQGPMDGISVEDAGPAVASVFAYREEFLDKKIGLSAGKIKPEQYMAILSKELGKTFKCQYIPLEVFEKLPFPGAAYMAAMYDFYERGNPDRDIELTKRLNPKARDFETWVHDNKANFKY